MKISGKPKTKARKKKSKSGPGYPESIQQHPNLEDRFQKSTKAQEKHHLMEHHRSLLETQEKLHRARIKALHEQLQLQLYQIWHDVWLQRQRVLDKSFREWLKVFMG